jgi:replicative DNA helicase
VDIASEVSSGIDFGRDYIRGIWQKQDIVISEAQHGDLFIDDLAHYTTLMEEVIKLQPPA